jgi:hypothetical protein
LLIKGQDAFHAEKEAVYEAGLRSSPWQHTDDTGTRVNGQNWHCHIVCNPLYTTYHTLPGKNRLSVLDVLRHGRERVFRLNDEALGYLKSLSLPKAARQTLLAWCAEQDLDEAVFLNRLDTHLPKLGRLQRKAIMDAAAVAAYHAEVGVAVVHYLRRNLSFENLIAMYRAADVMTVTPLCDGMAQTYAWISEQFAARKAGKRVVTG